MQVISLGTGNVSVLGYHARGVRRLGSCPVYVYDLVAPEELSPAYGLVAPEELSDADEGKTYVK